MSLIRRSRHGATAPAVPPRFPTQSWARFNFMPGHVSALLMKNRLLTTDFAALFNRASLLSALAFAVMAAAFRCSADRLRCYRITAKTRLKALIYRRNISNKSPEKAPEKISFAVLSLFRPDNSENWPSAVSILPHSNTAPVGRGSGSRRGAEARRECGGRKRPGLQATRVSLRNGKKARLLRSLSAPQRLCANIKRSDSREGAKARRCLAGGDTFFSSHSIARHSLLRQEAFPPTQPLRAFAPSREPILRCSFSTR